MPTRCLKCGAEVDDESPVCRVCFEPVKRPGFFARLFRKFFPGVSVTFSSSIGTPGSTTRTLSVRANQTFKFRNAKTGEVHEYHSLDEVPVEFRALAREIEEGTEGASKIAWTDSAGTVHHCNSIDDLPPHMREVYQKALTGKPLGEGMEELGKLIREAEEAGLGFKRTTKITWTDSSGTVHHCNSIEEMPPEMRAIYQKALGEKGKLQ